MTEPDNPYETLGIVGDMPTQKKATKFSLLELLVVVGIIAVLIAILLPSPQNGHGHTRECKNNLNQISLALHNYLSVYHAFPPAYTVNSAGKPLHSWRTLILPYLERRDVYDSIDLSKPWDDPVNAVARGVRIPVYCCPETVCPANLTTYLAIVSSNGPLHPTEPRKISEFKYGFGETLMVIDVASAQAVPWMSPQDANVEFVLALGSRIEMAHPGGTNVAFVNGRVGFLDVNTSAAERRALISIAENGETGSAAGR